MKKSMLFCAMAVTFISCEKSDDLDLSTNLGLIGDWKLIEVYADPGAGGNFVPVNSQKTISFLSNGTVSSNGSLCSMSIDTNAPTTGTYSLTDSTITSPDCNPSFNLPFEVNGNILIVSYPCIEPCEAKYQKQ